MWRAILALIVLLLMPVPAFAGAWTLARHHLQIISGTIFATADRAYDNDGRPTIGVHYQKVLTQTFTEYGLTKRLTLFLCPEYAVARTGPMGGFAAQAKDAAIGGGVRFQLTDKIGVVSLQATMKTAGAFNLSVSANGVSGQQAELRLLYGKSFKLLHRDAFADLEIAERWVSGERPNEVPIDLTLGWSMTRRLMLMAQSFNTISSSARAPFNYYRSHKLELSAVYKVSAHTSLNVGAFVSPAGQNALEENGFVLSIWTKL